MDAGGERTNEVQTGWRRRLGVGPRIALTMIVTVALAGGAGYVLVTRTLEDSVIKHQRIAQTTRATEIAVLARRDPWPEAVHDMREIVQAAARQPGTKEVLVIGPDYRVIAAHDPRLVGTRDVDMRLRGAIEHGVSYAGREADPKRDTADFEFVRAIRLHGRPYAFEESYGHALFDGEVAELRRSIAIIALLGLLGGGLVFYLLGGRALLRTYRVAVERATRDGLTDLGNQRAFQDEFEHAVALANRHGDVLSLALIDLDDFKFINDRHGHKHGDELLLRAARVLCDGRAGDRAFRVGGDEFAVLLPRTDAGGATIAMRRLQASFALAQIPASVGLSTREGMDGTTLREEADAALYEAKRRGGGALVLYDDIRHQVAITTGVKVAALRKLLAEGDLSVFFQPIWDLDRATLLGVEALARPGEHYGFNGPAEAFDIAEQIGRVHDLDALCVEKILAEAPSLPEGALLFINISPRTLELDSADDSWLVAAVDRAGIDPSCVVIEVTERFGGRMAAVLKTLLRLRGARLKLALDDVGAGNSGLEMLRSVDFEFVKIDRSVVTDAQTEAGARAVLLAMATFANETGSLVIAEGIEDETTLEFVRRLEEDLSGSQPRIQGGQGYGLGRPAPRMADPVCELLEERSRRTAASR